MHAGARGEGRADEEVAVAVQEGHGHPRLHQVAQRRLHALRDLAVVVVADPALEQVAEDVQRLRRARLAAQEGLEQRGDVRPRRVEVQVGDEERGHRASVTEARRRAGTLRPGCPE